MSNTTILPESVRNVNIAAIVFEAIEESMPNRTEELCQIMKQVRPLISRELYSDLEFAVNTAISQATEDGFTAGWELRAKA